LSTVDVDFIIPREGGMIWTVTQTNKETGVVEKQETFKVLHDAFARSDEWKAAVPRGEIPKKTVPKHNNFSEQWVFPVTDEMREVALAGVPQFAQKVVGNQSTIFDLKDQNYSLSFDEYLAHRMERAGARVKVGADGKLEYASDLDRVMGKHIFNRFTSLYESIVKASEANPEIAKAWSAEDHPYDAFIRRILVKNEWDRVMERVLKQGEVGLIDILMDKKVIPGMDPKMWAGLQEHLDNFNAAMGLSLNLIQLAKLNPHTFLKPYYEATANEWAAHGRTLMKMSVDTLHAWRRLGKEGSNKVTNVLMQETLDKEPYTPTQIGQKLTPAEAEVYYRIRSDLNHVLNEMERITRLAAEVNYSYDPERLETTLKEIELNFGEMRNSGYFPLMRHGKHLVIVRADKETIIDGKKYKKHDLVHWEAFDYEYERNAAARELGKNPDLRVGIDTMTDTAYAVQGIPLPMMRMLRARLEASGATSKVLSELDDAIKNALPLQSFHRKFLKRRGIAGFSKDFERSYARYMSSAANHMSRVEAGEVLRQILVQGEQEARILRETGRDATKRSAMVEWAKKHHQYLMNPQNELQGLRSFAFLWYLGFNIKSAAVNLTQPLITGYPYLADQFGDVAATKHMILANKDIAAYFKDRAEWLQAAMKEEDRKFAYVQEVAPGQFALDGMHQLFDLNDPQGKFFNLTGLKMANTNDPDVVQKLITTRLAQVKREVVVNQPLQQTLEAALSLYAATPSVLSQQDFEMMTLSEALPEAGYDGVVVDSNGDSIVLVPHRTLDKRQIPLKEAVKRSQIQSGDLRGELMRMIQRGQSEGWLDQSLAMELAIAASENKVDRLAPIHAGQRAYYKIAEWGSLPFHAAEKMNRLLMAISYYRAAREEGIDAKAAEQGARECVRLTMYEHTNWNRPVFMRGKKSLLFVFKNYVQNTAFTALQGDGTALRMWLVLGMMAGLQGLPFAEDLADLIDYVATEFKEKLGLSNPKVQIRQEARQILEELNLNPDLILHGFAQETFGLPWISHNLGFGAPGFDLASSISMGNVIPGTQLPSILSHQGSDRALATAIREFGGAALSAGEGALRAGPSSDPNDAKRLERFLPAFARNVAKSVRYGDQGGEFAASGDPIANFDPFSTREQIELIGQAGGFTPTKVSRGWERYMAERELVQYYQARSAALTKAYSHAVYLQDREAMADTMKAIQTYNSAVPYPEMRIGASLDGKNTLAQSVVDYVESQQKHKLGKGEALKYYRLVEEIRAGYKNPVAEDTVDNE
jgi:hypothetical protein